MSGESKLSGPDLEKDGIPLEALQEGRCALGHAGGESVLVVRRGARHFAIGATCTHYGGPLAEGRVVGNEVRCPWHHACFSLETGEPLHAPALNPVSAFEVETREGRLFVTGKKAAPPRRSVDQAPESVVIVGAGAAGHAAAEMLRREGYDGPITLIGEDPAAPYDRPNLSKDYLAGNAPEEWIPLRPDDFYGEQRIDLRRETRVEAIDPGARTVTLAGGETLSYGALLLATGASPVKLDVPGADLPHVFTLRTLADSRAIIARAGKGKRAVVVGSSFIGLEVAASLRAREVEVDVVSLDARPLERVLGEQLGDFLHRLHEEKGVRFHLQRSVKQIDSTSVTLDDGVKLPAGLVVVGIGVRPNLGLAERAGLAIDRGVTVDAYLQTSAPGIWAAGDIARWPDARTGEAIRVEHWVVAQRQGQAAAKNILGRRAPFDAVPFFWSNHYDVAIAYLGHASGKDPVQVEGDLAKGDCSIRFLRDGKVRALATIGRDAESLATEEAWERETAGG
jgi:3-phenylpropionate/trans-cinnamate dioxygenase ferredoxin reductase subunit